MKKTLTNTFLKSVPNLQSVFKRLQKLHSEWWNGQSERDLTATELKETFFSLKNNKSSGYDGIIFSVIKTCFGLLSKPLMHIFNLSVPTGTFRDERKIARVTPILKAGDNKELGNYRPLSALPCFSKILESIKYNRLFIYLTANEILYKKVIFKWDTPLNMQYSS